MKIAQLHQYFLESKGVSTDTRNIKENSMFFALKGKQFNGNEYALEALNQFGFFKGGYLMLKRILKCNPWGSHGHDPVPEK